MNETRQHYRPRLDMDTFKLPSALFLNAKKECERQSSGKGMALLTDLLHLYGKTPYKTRIAKDEAMVSAALRDFERHSGCSKSRVPGYMQEIAPWVKPLKSSRENAGNTYVFMNPATGLPIPSFTWDAEHARDNDGPHVFVNAGIQYFMFPACMVTSADFWAIRHMKGYELELLYALWWTADHKENKTNSTTWTGTVSHLRTAAKLDAKTFDKAMKSLVLKGLVTYTAKPMGPGRRAMYDVELLNPYTRSPFARPGARDEDDDRNYTVTGLTGKRRQLRTNLNPFDRKDTHAWLDEVGYVGLRADNDNYWVQIICPYHDDHVPSCGVTPWGFHCRTCGEQGRLGKLAVKLGHAEYEPVSDTATESYIHRDLHGATLYRVARYLPDLPNGKKDMRFERRGRKGARRSWLKGYNGRKTLYNQDRTQYARTVILTEGHKDANTATDLGFVDEWGNAIIGCTSGGAQSWNKKLIKDLQGRRIIFTSDNDESGDSYREAVRASFATAGMVEGVDFIEIVLPGVKDLTEFRARPEYTHEELARLIGHGWVGGIPGNDKINFGGVTYYDETIEA